MIFLAIFFICLLQIALRYLIRRYSLNKHLNVVVLLIVIIAHFIILPVLFEPKHNNPIAVGTNHGGLFVFLQFWFLGIPTSIITHLIGIILDNKASKKQELIQ